MNSEKIEIAGAGFGYYAHVGSGLLAEVGPLVRELLRANRAVIITDANVPNPLIEPVGESLADCDFRVSRIVLAPGESSKSLREVERVCGEMAECDRTSVVIGIGGGMVGDLSGFVAAVFHRGIPHVQIPTTLLAMLDSSIGGKTAVNLAAGKNLVGAVHQPVLVVADVDALRTLPARELRQGYAEIVKHAIIGDAEMFHALSSRAKQSEADGSRDESLKVTSAGSLDLARDDIELIARNIRIKAAIVAQDERETSGERALLNFGHTIGHAIERASDYSLAHGDCVSLGLVAACTISVERAGLANEQRGEIIALLRYFGLPTKLPSGIARAAVIEAVRRDKKFERGEVRFVVTPRIGEAYVSREVTMEDIRRAVENL